MLLEYRQKSKDSFGCYKKKFTTKLLETQAFIEGACSEECRKENISVDKVVFSINKNC